MFTGSDNSAQELTVDHRQTTPTSPDGSHAFNNVCISIDTVHYFY